MYLVFVYIIELNAVDMTEMQQSLRKLGYKLGLFFPKRMRVELDIFSTNNDDG
jgi:hypothetical protein